MSKIINSKIVYVLWLMIQGAASFLISGLIACIAILHLDNYILGTIIAGGIGGLLLGLFHWKHKMIGRMTIAGLIAVPIGLLGSFILVEGLVGGFGLLFPSVAAYFENSNIPDIIAIILMGSVFGAVFGAIVYSRKSIGLFSIVCGAVSIPFGLLVGAMNSGHWIKVWLENLFKVFGNIDLNFLAIITEFGMGIGLCIGLYIMLKQKSIGHD
ncbi:MAG: hypothetical protein ACOX0F_05865 [Syntrophomonadaceae bacterium]